MSIDKELNDLAAELSNKWKPEPKKPKGGRPRKKNRMTAAERTAKCRKHGMHKVTVMESVLAALELAWQDGIREINIVELLHVASCIQVERMHPSSPEGYGLTIDEWWLLRAQVECKLQNMCNEMRNLISEKGFREVSEGRQSSRKR